MLLKANVRIVVRRRRCRQKNDLAMRPQHRLGQRYKLGSDALFLKIYIDSKIREIAAIIKICYRASNANEEALLPARGN